MHVEMPQSASQTGCYKEAIEGHEPNVPEVGTLAPEGVRTGKSGILYPEGRA